MLNEKNEINSILEGKRINKKYTYRSCYLLAKYFKSLGKTTTEAREEVFKWANKYGIYITDDLNSIIQRAYSDKREIAEDVEIRVNREDMEEIIKRFDKYNTRLTAFAILCFAKKHADKEGVFYISQMGLSNWIGISQSHLSNRHIKELIDFNFLQQLSVNSIKFIKRKNKHVSKMLIYKITVNFDNVGEFIIQDNNIRLEFENIVSVL